MALKIILKQNKLHLKTLTCIEVPFLEKFQLASFFNCLCWLLKRALFPENDAALNFLDDLHGLDLIEYLRARGK